MNASISPLQPAGKPSGQHACCFYETDEQQQATLKSFLCRGLDAGEKTLCILEPKTAESFLQYVRDAGIGPEPHLENGQLELLTFDETYLADGVFSSKSMLSRLQAETQRALQEGYRALRVASEMTWTLQEMPDREELIAYESEANLFFEKFPCKAICLYDLREFPPDLLLDILGAHPSVMIGAEKHVNFFYISPSELPAQASPQAVFKQRLQKLIEQNREINAYRALVEHSMQGWVILDGFNIVYANPAFSEITGYTIEELLSLNSAQIRALVHPDDQPLVWGRFQDRLQGKSVPPRYVYRGVRKDGEILWLQMYVTPVEFAGKSAMQAAVLDITEQKRSEEALRESEVFSHSIVSHSPDAIILTDEQGLIVTWNDSAEQITGLNRGDVVGRPLWDVQYQLLVSELKTPELKDTMKAIQTDLLVNGEASHLHELTDLEIERPDGTRLSIQTLGFAIPTEKGYQLGGIIRDVTESKLAEEALRSSEELYRTLLLTSPDAVTVTDLNGVITQVSDQAIKLHGAESADELIGEEAINLFAEQDRERAIENIVRTFQEGHVRGIEYRLLRREGTLFFGEYNATLIKDADGNPKSIIAAVRDITERVEAEKKLRESEERYRALVEDMPALICRFLPDGTLTFVNEHYSRYFNKEKKALIGQNFFQFIPIEDRDRVRAHFASLTPANSVITYEHKVWVSDGVARWQRWTDRALFDAQEQAVEYQSIGEDITDQKNADLEIREAYQHLQEALSELKAAQKKAILQERLAAIGQLAAGIAHDFSNTLMPITLYSDLLLRELELPSKQKARLELILQQARRAASFTQQILDFSRQSLMRFRPIELQAFLEKMTDLLRRTLPENIEIKLVSGPEEYRIDGDIGRIEQALMNLGVNARDAMPEGGQLQFELSHTHFSPEHMPPIPEMRPGDWICISVQDTGEGIPPDQLAHIFEPFYPNGESSLENGLGLAQVYGIIKQHKGFINVTSQIGEGTRFDLYIPASEHEGSELIIDSADIAPTSSTQILVVEDDDSTREALCEILEALQYRVLGASSGVEALKLFNESEIDLVMSDLVMPEMGGAALYSALRELDPDVKLIVITGYPLEEMGRDLIDQGITAWVQKPFDIEKISQTIRTALGTKPP